MGILAGIGLVAAFAVADALRARDEPAASSPPSSRVATSSLRHLRTAAPLRPGLLAGRLVLTDADCAVRVIDLARLRPAGRRREASCGLWGSPRGDRFAYGVDVDRAVDRPSRALAFRIGTLENRAFDADLHHGVPGSIRWSPDGRRVAWCDHYGTPVELDLDASGRRRLPACPVGYTTSGRRAYVSGGRVVVDGRTIVVAPAPPSLVNFAENGTIGVVTPREIVVYEARGEARATVARPHSRGAPLLAPNNCAALVRSPHDAGPPQVALLPLACRGVRGRAFVGSDAAWSPDARWIAVADDAGITFYPFARPGHRLRLAVRAQNLLWKDGG